MSRKKAGKRNRPAAAAKGKGKLLAIIALIIALTMASAFAAQRTLLLSLVGFGTSSESVVTPPASPQTQPTLAKEYIYGGGRLLATEEPPGGGGCIYSINPSSNSLPASGGGGNISVMTQQGCNWTASTIHGWITVTPSSGSGNGTVMYTVASNPTTNQRTGTIAIADKSFTVIQSGNSCTFTLDSTSQPFTSSAGSGQVNVSTQAGCQWTATSNNSWIQITSGQSVSGSGTVNYSVDQNTSTVQRTGTMTIAGQTFTVTQAGASGSSNPQPVLTDINPRSVSQNSQGFELQVTGFNFVLTSVVKINGNARATTFDNTGLLRANILTSDLTSAGPKPITVTNPAPNGGTSNIVFLTVTSGTARPRPSISSISPSQVAQNSGSFELTVNGTGFINGVSVVKINNANRATTFVSGSELKAQILSTDIAFTGPKTITVYTTPSGTGVGGGQSNKAYLNVTPSGGGGGGSGTGLKGEYFNELNFGGPVVVTRTDSTVDFNWGGGSPHSSIGGDTFSARWTGKVEAIGSGTYTFYTLTDDGVRLWVNGVKLIDRWQHQPATEWNGSIFLTGGQKYDITMEYYENTGDAMARLFWQGPSIQKQIIPQGRLYPPTVTQPLYEGVHEVANCNTISGWAVDRNQLSSSINVDIYDNGVFHATVSANAPRTGIPYPGNHGFSYTVPQSLKNGQLHTISVRFSGTSTPLTGTPQSIICSGTTAPAAPSNLVATPVNGTQINLTWNHVGDNEDGFTIERREGTGAYEEIGSVNANIFSYPDMGRSPGVTYYYRVKAYNGVGSSAYSNEAMATPPGGTDAPAPPSNLVATALTNRQIQLTWNDNSNNETGFKVYRRLEPGGALSLKLTLPANTTSYIDKKLASNTTYCYVVRAYNGVGDSTPDPTPACATAVGTLSPCGQVSGFSGDGSNPKNSGYQEGAPGTAKWASPGSGVVGIDPVSGLNVLFVADTNNHRIRMVYLEGPAEGHSTLIAGSGIAGFWNGDGNPYQARYNFPRGITALISQYGVIEALLIADTDNHLIRMLLPPAGGARWRPAHFSGVDGSGSEDPGPGYVDGDPQNSRYSSPYAITVGTDGYIYVADTYNAAIRRLDREGVSSTMYKDFFAEILGLGITGSEASEGVYVSDLYNHSIYKVTEGTRELIAGSGVGGYANGQGGSASFYTPSQLVWVGDQAEGLLYVADLDNHRIRLIELSGKLASSDAGSGTAGYLNGACSTAKFNSPAGLAISPSGDLYVIEKSNNNVRKINEQE